MVCKFHIQLWYDQVLGYSPKFLHGKSLKRMDSAGNSLSVNETGSLTFLDHMGLDHNSTGGNMGKMVLASLPS